MASKKSSNFFKAQTFASSLRTLVDSLPSDSERQQLDSQLETLIQFLTDLRHKLNGIPSREDAANTRAAIERLNALFAQAKTSPFLAAALGIKATPSRPKAPSLSSDEIERARSTLARLEPLTLDEIRTTLNSMTRRDLQGVASAMGIRATQRTAQETLVHQIATKITNTRGYRSLRDGTDEHATLPEDNR